MDSLDLYDEMLCESTDTKLGACKPEPEEESIDMYSDFDDGVSAQDHEGIGTLVTESKPIKTSGNIAQEEESLDLYSNFMMKSNTNQTSRHKTLSLKPSQPPPAEESLDLYSEFVGVKSEHVRPETSVSDVKMESSSTSTRTLKDEGGVDLDLFTEVLTDELQHKHDSHLQLAKKLTVSEARIKELELELKEGREKQLKSEAESIVIKKNMSSLLLTARNELKRKDNEIRRLNLILAKKKVNSYGMRQDNSKHLNEMSPSHRTQTRDRRNHHAPTSSRHDSDSETVKRKRAEPVDQGTPKRQKVDLDRQSRTPDTKDRKLDSRCENKYSNSEKNKSANNSGRNNSKERFASEKKESERRSDRKVCESRSSSEWCREDRPRAERGNGRRSSAERSDRSRSSAERGRGARSITKKGHRSGSSAERGEGSRSSAERSRSSAERGSGSRSSAERNIDKRSVRDRLNEKRAKIRTEDKDSSRSLDSVKNHTNQSESDIEKKLREKDYDKKKLEDSSQKSKKKTSVLDLRDKLRNKRSEEKVDSGNSDNQLVQKKVILNPDAMEVKETADRKMERKTEHRDFEHIEIIEETKTSTEKGDTGDQSKICQDVNLDFKKEIKIQPQDCAIVENKQSEGKSQESFKNCKTQCSTFESSGSPAVLTTFQTSTNLCRENGKTPVEVVDQCNNLTPADQKAKRRIKPILLTAKKSDSADSSKGQSCLDSVIENIERRESLEFAQAKVVHVDTSLESCSSAFSLSKSPDAYSSKSSVLESISFTCRSDLVSEKSQKHPRDSGSLPSLTGSKHLCSESSEMILKSHSDFGTNKSDSFSKYSDISSIAPSESASSHVQKQHQFMAGNHYSVENEHLLLCTANPFPNASSTCLSHVSTESGPDTIASDISERECSLGFIIEDESCSRTVPYSYEKSKEKKSETKDDKSDIKSGKKSKKNKFKENEYDGSEKKRDETEKYPQNLDGNELKSTQTTSPGTNFDSRTVVNCNIPNGLVQRDDLMKESSSSLSKKCQIDNKLACGQNPSDKSSNVPTYPPVCPDSVPCIDCRLNGHKRPPYHVEPIEFTGFPQSYAKSESEDDDRLVINMPQAVEMDFQSSDMDTRTEKVAFGDGEMLPKANIENETLEQQYSMNQKDNSEISSGFKPCIDNLSKETPFVSLEAVLPGSSLDKQFDERGFRSYGRQMSLPETNSQNLRRARSSSVSYEGVHQVFPDRPKSTPLPVYQPIDLSVNSDAENTAKTTTMSDFSVSEDGALDLSRRQVFISSSQHVKPVHLKEEPIIRDSIDEALSDNVKAFTSGFKLYRPPIVPQRSLPEKMEMDEEILIDTGSQSVSEMSKSSQSSDKDMTKKGENNFKIDELKENNNRIHLTTLKVEQSEVHSKETVMDVDEDSSADVYGTSQKNLSNSLPCVKACSAMQSSTSTSLEKDSNQLSSESESEDSRHRSPNNPSSVSHNTSASQSTHSLGSQASPKSDRAFSSQSSARSDKTSSSQESSKSDKPSTSSQESSKSNKTSTSSDQSDKTSSSQELSKTDQDSASSQVSLVQSSSKPSDHSFFSDESAADEDDSSNEDSDVCVTDNDDLDCESSQSQLLVKSISTKNIPSSSRSFDLVQDLQISDDSSISCKESPESMLATKTSSYTSIEETDFKFPDMSKSSFGKSPKSPKLSKIISPEVPRKLSFPQDENTVLSILADSCDGFDCESGDHKEDCRKHIPESAAEPDPDLKDEDEDLQSAKDCDDDEDRSEDSETYAEDGEITEDEVPTMSSKGPVVHDEETQELMELLKAKKLLEEKILGICSRSETNSDDQKGPRANDSRGKQDRRSHHSSRDERKDNRYTREIHRSDPRLNSRHRVRDKDEPRHRTYSPSRRHNRRNRDRNSSPVGRRDSSRDHDNRRDQDKQERYSRDAESDRKGRSGHSSRRRSRDVR